MKVRIGYGFGTQRGFTAASFDAMVDALEDLRLRLALALGAHHRRRARPDHRARRGSRSDHQAQARHQRAGALRPQPRAARQGAREPRRPLRRPIPPGLRTRHRTPGGAAGVRHRTDRPRGVVRGGPPAHPPVLDRGSRSTTTGARFHYEGLRVRPHPVQQPPDIWLGGRAPAELRRVGRLADGWLASFSMPDECAAGRDTIETVAAEHARTIDPEHFGAMIFYASGPIPEAVRDADRSPVSRRRSRRSRSDIARRDRAPHHRVRRRRDLQARAGTAACARRLARRAEPIAARVQPLQN